MVVYRERYLYLDFIPAIPDKGEKQYEKTSTIPLKARGDGLQPVYQIRAQLR
jgi:hypothetical protein